MFGSRRFGDAQLERLYRSQQVSQSTNLILHVLCMLTASFLLLALNHLPNPDVTLLFAVVAAASALILQVVLMFSGKESKPTVYSVVVVWLFCVVIGCVPAGGQAAIIPSIIAYTFLYTAFKYDLLSTVILALLIATIQIVGFVLFPTEPFTIHQLLATCLVHGWCNFVGIYLYMTCDRLCRAGFLNARNALISQKEAIKEADRMGLLLGTTLPEHVIAAVRNQIGVNVPKLYIENYDVATVIYGKLYGLEAVLSQISVQDSVRLLNEFNAKINQLAKRNNLIRILGDGIVAVSGVPTATDGHTDAACQFAWELVHVLRSFCDAANVELAIKIGISTGPVSAGIVGANKWHYEVVGTAVTEAINAEKKALPNQIVLTKAAAQLVKNTYASEVLDDEFNVLIATARVASTIPNGMLFQNNRRFSVSTVPQVVSRLLMASTVPPLSRSESMSNSMYSIGDKGLFQGRRKQKQYGANEMPIDDSESLMSFFTLRFKEKAIEKSYNMVIDSWFIPALAISIFFLVVYGLYQVLVMPRLIPTLALIIATLAAMFIILLMLYVNYFETFCYFITRTFMGHSLSILLLLTLLFMCGVVNVFSCPSLKVSPVCHNVFYSIISCVLWIISTMVFIRYNSLLLAFTLLSGIAVYCLQIFVTHQDLYTNYAIIVGWRIEFDLVISLVALASLVYFQARRNERIIRLDYLSLLRSVEEDRQIQRFEYVNSQILLNALPHHIAYNYTQRTDPYCHMCHSVGVLKAQLGNPSNWHGEIGLNRLNQIIYQLDRLIENYPGLEKVKSAHCHYVVAVGVLPEITRNIQDTPFTIGDLLAALTNFALTIKETLENDGLEVQIGIDCGSALSVVIGSDQPRYDVVGMTSIRATTLMNAASGFGILVSEEIYLALRPRNFHFAHANPITIEPNLIGYYFVFNRGPQQNGLKLRNASEALSVNETVSIDVQESVPSEPSPPTFKAVDPISNNIPANAVSVDIIAHNPLEIFQSMNSSMSSDMCSIDIDVESDSEMEWVTPESAIFEKHKIANHEPDVTDPEVATPVIKRTAGQYKSERARQYSDLSENDFASSSSLVKRRRYRPFHSRNGPRVPGWLTSRSSLNSDISMRQSRENSLNAVERLNNASGRVDKMLMELANVDESNAQNMPFPLSFSGISTSMKSIDNRRELSSACHTEYDNAESEDACSDSEMVTSSRLEELKNALRGFQDGRNDVEKRRNNRARNTERFLSRRLLKHPDGGHDADVDSNCSSLASSSMFDKLRWKSVHSIGYDNEYEFAYEAEENGSGFDDTGAAPEPELNDAVNDQQRPDDSVGANADFLPMDASDSEGEEVLPAVAKEVEALSRDIREKFGEYNLATFPDADASS